MSINRIAFVLIFLPVPAFLICGSVPASRDTLISGERVAPPFQRSVSLLRRFTDHLEGRDLGPSSLPLFVLITGKILEAHVTEAGGGSRAAALLTLGRLLMMTRRLGLVGNLVRRLQHVDDVTVILVDQMILGLVRLGRLLPLVMLGSVIVHDYQGLGGHGRYHVARDVHLGDTVNRVHGDPGCVRGRLNHISGRRLWWRLWLRRWRRHQMNDGIFRGLHDATDG